MRAGGEIGENFSWWKIMLFTFFSDAAPQGDNSQQLEAVPPQREGESPQPHPPAPPPPPPPSGDQQSDNSKPLQEPASSSEQQPAPAPTIPGTYAQNLHLVRQPS